MSKGCVVGYKCSSAVRSFWQDSEQMKSKNKQLKSLWNGLKDADYTRYPQDLWKLWRTSEPADEIRYEICYSGAKTITGLKTKIYILTTGLGTAQLCRALLLGREKLPLQQGKAQLHMQHIQPAVKNKATGQTQDAHFFCFWVVSVSKGFLQRFLSLL